MLVDTRPDRELPHLTDDVQGTLLVHRHCVLYFSYEWTDVRGGARSSSASRSLTLKMEEREELLESLGVLPLSEKISSQ